jgi:putative redox protein
MNAGMTITYQGHLRNQATHLRSGNTLITDAPTDNHGKGEAFSPTDLLCTSLASCMITLMGIAAESKGIALEKVEAQIEKVMYSDPRRVGEIHVRIGIGDKGYTEREKAILENAAMTCPVSKSLHPDIKQVIAFNYES